MQRTTLEDHILELMDFDDIERVLAVVLVIWRAKLSMYYGRQTSKIPTTIALGERVRGYMRETEQKMKEESPA